MFGCVFFAKHLAFAYFSIAKHLKISIKSTIWKIDYTNEPFSFGRVKGTFSTYGLYAYEVVEVIQNFVHLWLL